MNTLNDADGVQILKVYTGDGKRRWKKSLTRNKKVFLVMVVLPCRLQCCINYSGATQTQCHFIMRIVNID